ncbi:hypothetical protein BU15DRAFT_66829 [Melanogaster broomeanus]|nr:hypothetical protein BU15DRAFT_66829 [Melanogaster broomeanus]
MANHRPAVTTELHPTAFSVKQIILFAVVCIFINILMRYLPSSFPVEIPSAIFRLHGSTIVGGPHGWQSSMVPMPHGSIGPHHSLAVPDKHLDRLHGSTIVGGPHGWQSSMVPMPHGSIGPHHSLAVPDKHLDSRSHESVDATAPASSGGNNQVII